MGDGAAEGKDGMSAGSHEPADLDPRWQWVELRRLCDVEPRYIKGPCNHLEVVPVEAGGEIVARLCQTCDSQLPA